VDYGLDMHNLLLREKGVPADNYKYNQVDMNRVNTDMIREEYEI